MALNGNNILVYLNGTAIAGSTTADAQNTVDLVEIGSPLSSGQWKQYIKKRKTWSVTVNYLVLQYSGVRDLLKVGDSYTLKIRGRNSSESTGVSGTAILKTCRITAQRGNLVQGTFQFQGNSSLS
ncbi:MAG: hypothetical protein IKA00_03110 [Prevotella sp.]|nr:hypothetical protein [Prevotella sp.]